MAKFTISADSLEELFDAVDTLRGHHGDHGDHAEPPSAGAQSAEAPKRQTRKKAEPPPPLQPEPTKASADAPNPFGQPAAEASPFPGSAPFAPGAADPHANVGAERPAVTKLKEHLLKLTAQHGEPQVYKWAIVTGFGLSDQVTKEEFLGKLIHEQSDAALEAVYKKSGGQ